MFTKFIPGTPLRVRAALGGTRGAAGCERGPCCRGTRSNTEPELPAEEVTGTRATNAHENRNRSGTFIIPSYKIPLFTLERVERRIRKFYYGVIMHGTPTTECANSKSPRALKDTRVYYPSFSPSSAFTNSGKHSRFPHSSFSFIWRFRTWCPIAKPPRMLFKKWTVKIRRSLYLNRRRWASLFWSSVVERLPLKCARRRVHLQLPFAVWSFDGANLHNPHLYVLKQLLPPPSSLHPHALKRCPIPELTIGMNRFYWMIRSERFGWKRFEVRFDTANRFTEPVQWSESSEWTDSQKWIRHPLH